MYRSVRATALLAAVVISNALFVSTGSSTASVLATPLDGTQAALGRHLLHPHPPNDGMLPAAAS